jgi:hypothetical protein
VKSEEPIGWRRKSRPSPLLGLKRSVIVASSCLLDSRDSTTADESVIDAPKPSMRW